MCIQKLSDLTPTATTTTGLQQIGRHEGFSLIELLFVVAVIGIICAIAIPHLLASRRAANEASAIGALRSIGSGELTYRATLGAGEFGDLTQLAGQRIIDNALAGATTPNTARSGYFYAVTVADESYFSGAIAVTASAGTRRFSSDNAGVIYGDTSNPTVIPTATVGTPIGY